MPVYEVSSPDGRRFRVEGDEPPAESDLDEIFKSAPEAKSAADDLVAPRFKSPIDLPPVSDADIAETRSLGSPVRNAGKGFNFLGKALIGVPADLGSVAFRPLIDELYPEQATEGPVDAENLKAIARNEPLPAKDFRPLPKSLQIIGQAAQGLIETTPRLAAVAGLQAVGVPAPVAAGAIFGATEEGFDPKQAAVAAALPFVGKYSGAMTEALAAKLGVTKDAALAIFNKLGGATGAAALLKGVDEVEISKLPPEQRDQARINSWAGIAGQAALGMIGEREPKNTTEPVSPKASSEPTPPGWRYEALDSQGKIHKGELPPGIKGNEAYGKIRDMGLFPTKIYESDSVEPTPEAVPEVTPAVAPEVKPGNEPETKPAEPVVTPAPETKPVPSVTNPVPETNPEPIATASYGFSNYEKRSDGWWEVSREPESKDTSSLPQKAGPAISDQLDTRSNPTGAQSESDSPITPESQAAKEAGVTEDDIRSGFLGEAGMGAAKVGELEEEGSRDVTGIAERVRTLREKSGHTAPTEPGEGIAPEASVERGRALLPTSDPEKIMSEFESTGRFSSDDVAIVRAKMEQLAKATNLAEEKFGTDSEEFRNAYKVESDWASRTKKMQTEWAKSGHAQQGEVDIDTGTFSGLSRAFREETGGKEFTPKQRKKATSIADKSSKAADAVAGAKENLYDQIDKDSGGTRAERRALDAANKTVREAAARLAKAEVKERVAKSKVDKSIANEQINASRRALEAANKRVREASVNAAKAEAKLRASKADTSTYAWTKAKEYIENGVDDFNDIRNKLATDLGMSVEKVTEALAKTKRAKFLADELWRKQQSARDIKTQAKIWLRHTTTPGFLRAIQSVPRVLFGLKVGFHGTVALGTHAPMVAFQPRFWKTYVTDFAKMYRMVGSPAYYERQMQDLVRRPNYVTARRAGLVNDPFSFEDYNNPDIAKYFGRISGMGNRGYAILKVLRQDMFDQMWDQLPRTAKVKEVAEALSDGLNHATGVVKGMAPPGSSLALFAPRLMGSRVAWLAVDPAKALMTATNWKNSTEGEKIFAINQIKEKAWVIGTMMGALAINQGILSAVGSNQKINLDDPLKSDFLKFKIAGMSFSYGNAMISMARLPIRLYQIRSSDGGKTKNLVHPDENSYSVLGEYARSQASPLASLLSSLWFKSDWQNRPLPNSTHPVPSRLRDQGEKAYTWKEFWSEQFLPIPIEEAAREVWKNGLGMKPEQIESARKALATIAVMSATGGRLVDDTGPKTVHGLLSEFNKSKPQADYSALRAAIDKNDQTGFTKAYSELIEAKKTPSKIDAAIRPFTPEKIPGTEIYINKDKPITGSYKTEGAFVKTLDADGKAAYDKAKKDRMEQYNQFKALRDKMNTP